MELSVDDVVYEDRIGLKYVDEDVAIDQIIGGSSHRPARRANQLLAIPVVAARQAHQLVGQRAFAHAADPPRD